MDNIDEVALRVISSQVRIQAVIFAKLRVILRMIARSIRHGWQRNLATIRQT